MWPKVLVVTIFVFAVISAALIAQVRVAIGAINQHAQVIDLIVKELQAREH